MEKDCQNLESNSKYLLEQLITARKEINNLRQQIKSLRYVHERDVNSIKRLLGLCSNGLASFPDDLSPELNISSRDNNEPSTSSTINDSTLTLRPIGTISTWFPNKRGTPRQPTICDRAPGKITLFKSIFTNPEHALEGLEEYSHMWILFHFHKNEVSHVRAKVSPPRLNGVRTGVFSTRSPHRPCPIGLSLVKILKIEDCTIYFEGVDMVDQTPILDIKPYIPHYDNPLHIERILQTIHSKEEMRDNNLAVSSIANVDGWIGNTVDEALATNDNSPQTYNQRTVNSASSSLVDNQSLIHISSSSSSSTSSLIDVSRDEELALRLQAEEFQENLNFENVYVSNENTNALEDNELAAIIASRNNLNPVGYNPADSEVNTSTSNERTARNTRLLDGADGPTAVCGTDLDLISRRALNLRLDDSSSSSSPIRMEVREAPDGEEGFDLSQTQNVPMPVNAVDSSSTNSNSQVVTRQTNESNLEEAVRVPDWISRPKMSPLSVVFNERSILQLREILNDKAEEKKRAVENVLKEDPRSVYLRRRYGNQFYTFLIHDLHITCKFDDDRKIVTVFQVRHAGRTCECGEPEWQCPGHSPTSVFSHDQ